jgi:uncharacterized protein (DUF58 family)
LVVLAGIPVILAAFALGLGWMGFWLYSGFVAAASIVDLASLPSRRQIRVARSIPARIEQGRPFEVGIEVSFSGRMPVSVQAADDLPLEFRPHGVMKAQVNGRQPLAFRYITEASARGNYMLRHIYIRCSGNLGLWERQVRLQENLTLRVYPDLSGVRGIMASMQHSLVLDGERIKVREQSGLDFHYIREYSPDDDPRAINWIASARTGRPMANVRQPERGKTVTLLIDCGRLMGMELDGQVKLDRAIEAALSLAAVALRQGDQVAMLAFSGEVLAYVPPGRTAAYLQDILEAVYPLKSEPSESNYSLALDYLLHVQRKRSMIVLFSDMENYLFEDELAPYLVKLRRNHALLLLSLEDPVVTAWTRAGTANLARAYMRTAAQTARLERKRFVGHMGSRGIPVLDVPAGQLALAAVNQYLEQRSRGLI